MTPRTARSRRPMAHDTSTARGRTISPADLQRAVAQGIVSAEQASALLALAERSTAPRAERLVPVGAEVAGYLGGALAMIGTGMFVQRFWSDIPTATRVLLFGILAALFGSAGALVDESGGAQQFRLRSILWLLSSAALAVASALLAVDALAWSSEPATLFTGAAVGAQAGWLWSGHRRPAQHVSFVAGVSAALVGAVGWAFGPGPVGAALWIWGATWAVLGRARVTAPFRLAVALGVGHMLAAPVVMEGPWPGAAPAVGLATASGLVVAGTTLGEFVMTALGLAGTMLYLPMAAATYFGEALGVPVAMLASGVLLILVMLVLLRRGVRPRPG